MQHLSQLSGAIVHLCCNKTRIRAKMTSAQRPTRSSTLSRSGKPRLFNFWGIPDDLHSLSDRTTSAVAVTVLFRMFAWLLATAVTFATLGPPLYRPHSNLGQDGEHTLAFFLVALAFGIAYPRHRLQVTAASIVVIAALEVMQMLVPGRHARLEDFIVDALAAIAGLAVVAGLDFAGGRMRRATPTPP
jgi:VanZ family protein